jgi:poly(A) polymerase
VFESRIGDISGRGKLGADMREIWMMQPRFEKRTGHTAFSLVEQPRFRAAFDFMRLRADIGEVDSLLADWWQEFSQASDAVREDLVEQLRDEQQKQQRRTRKPKPAVADDAREAAPAAAPRETDAVDSAGDDSVSDAPRKRRRRRRKPAGQGGDAGESAPRGDSAGPAD